MKSNEARPALGAEPDDGGDTVESQKSPKDRPTVLVVEDEELLRAVERRVLEDDGYIVREANNGAEGLDCMARDAHIDLLIADLDMPVLAGAEMVERIHASHPGVPVLFVTGRIDSLMDARPLIDGEAFLEKPFTPSGLREAVSLLLHGTIRKPVSETADTAPAAPSGFEVDALAPALQRPAADAE